MSYPDHRPSATNWTFVNSAGTLREFPAYRSANGIYLLFDLTSTAYYGNYSITLTNEIGSTAVTFQILPEGEFMVFEIFKVEEAVCIH